MCGISIRMRIWLGKPFKLAQRRRGEEKKRFLRFAPQRLCLPCEIHVSDERSGFHWGARKEGENV